MLTEAAADIEKKKMRGLIHEPVMQRSESF